MTNGNRYKIDTEKRISTLEANFDSLNQTLNEIKNNHLHTLEEKIDRLQWLLFVTIIGTALSVIIKIV